MHAPKQSIITPAIIVLTIFFMLLGLSNAGISNFGVVALMSGYDVIVLDRQRRADGVSRRQRRRRAGRRLSSPTAPGAMDSVAAACFAINAVIVLVIATIDAAVAAADRRDGGRRIPRRRDRALARHAGPQRRTAGAAGRAFGIVSTGFNFGGILSPLLFGWIMDQNVPHWVFGASVVFMVLTVLLALVTDRKPAGKPVRRQLAA